MRDLIAKVIDLANARDNEREARGTTSGKSIDVANETLDYLKNSPDRQVLIDFLFVLSDDELTFLIAAMYAGRDLCNQTDKPTSFSDYQKEFTGWNRNGMVDSMVSKRQLAEYLRAALSSLEL